MKILIIVLANQNNKIFGNRINLKMFNFNFLKKKVKIKISGNFKNNKFKRLKKRENLINVDMDRKFRYKKINRV